MSARDPYAVLGVAKTATSGEIKTAFRRLAKKYHPDTNKDNPEAQNLFGEISRAYEIIGDDKKRKQFDQGEIDAEGKQAGGFGAGDPFGGFRQRRNTTRSGGADGFNAEDIINQMFGGGMGGGSPFGGPRPQQAPRQPQPQKGKDIDVTIWVTVDDIFGSGKTTLKLTDGRTIAVTIPSPVEDGQVIRLKGQGMLGPQGHRGDLLARVRFKADNNMRIEGASIVIDAELPLETAVMGGKIAVATPKGKVALKVAPWSNSGTMLRLKERGLPKKDGSVGDIIVVLKITLENTDRAVLETLFASHTQTAQS